MKIPDPILFFIFALSRNGCTDLISVARVKCDDNVLIYANHDDDHLPSMRQ